MASVVHRKGDRAFAQCNIQIPLELKIKVEELKINLTQAAIKGIESEVAKHAAASGGAAEQEISRTAAEKQGGMKG